MKKIKPKVFITGFYILALTVFFQLNSFAQEQDKIIDAIVKEANENSMLEPLAHELLDEIGPRLTGTPQMKKANDWAVAKYQSWGISAKNEQWGQWRGWERGITHIDMITPWVRSLEGTQLAWSASTGGQTVTGDVIILPDLADIQAFEKWLPAVKGKFVMISMNRITGRPEYNWKEFATSESLEKMTAAQSKQVQDRTVSLRKFAPNPIQLALALEKAGAAGLVSCAWSAAFGTNKIFGAYAKTIPTIDLSLEDYGLLFRLTEGGTVPKISVRADSKELGAVPALNTIAEIKGSKKPDEYVILSAHFDSWDGGTGATDNGTGTLVMMEAMRILKKIYPKPKRTILVGHWGSEEQGMNGSRAFVEDHPDIIKNTQASFNQDSGTGRVVTLSGEGFRYAGDYLGRWLSKVPANIRDQIETTFPGNPPRGGSDNASLYAAGVPAFFLNSKTWLYSIYTWHTNRDTYDKIVFDDVRSNAILTAILVYMACEDPEKASREPGTNQPSPILLSPNRRGGME